MKTVKEIAQKIDELLPADIENVAFVCVGTDRSTGDSLGPLVGRYLQRRKVKNVIGTLNDPCHAMNLPEQLVEVEGKFIVGIDASLGSNGEVGQIKVDASPLKPGAGVGKDLGEVGNMRIVGIVNVSGFMPYHVLQNTRLSVVDDLATKIGRSICQVLRKRMKEQALAQIAAEKEV